MFVVGGGGVTVVLAGVGLVVVVLVVAAAAAVVIVVVVPVVVKAMTVVAAAAIAKKAANTKQATHFSERKNTTITSAYFTWLNTEVRHSGANLVCMVLQRSLRHSLDSTNNRQSTDNKK